MSQTHFITTFPLDRRWHLQAAWDIDTECGAGSGKVAMTVTPIPGQQAYDPGEAVVLSVLTGAEVCEDCCSVIVVRENLEVATTAEMMQALRVEHGC